jgi:hypothetical protein
MAVCFDEDDRLVEVERVVDVEVDWSGGALDEEYSS